MVGACGTCALFWDVQKYLELYFEMDSMLRKIIKIKGIKYFLGDDTLFFFSTILHILINSFSPSLSSAH